MRNSANVYTFLNDLHTRTRERAREELAILEREKRDSEGSATVELWDRSYYMGLCKATKYDLNALDIAEVSPHLSLWSISISSLTLSVIIHSVTNFH